MNYTVELYSKKKRKRRKISKLTGQQIYSRSELENGLWSVFSQFIRMRDRTCVLDQFGGCQGPLQAGHVIPRGKKPTKYDEANVFGQCAFHNKRHKWHPELYETWYANKFGAQALVDLKSRAQQEAKALTIDEIKKLTDYYAKKISKAYLPA